MLPDSHPRSDGFQPLSSYDIYHVRLFRGYLEDLRGEVIKYAREGKSLDDMKRLIKLEKYTKWRGYEQMLPLNIEGMYQHVQMHRRGN